MSWLMNHTIPHASAPQTRPVATDYNNYQPFSHLFFTKSCNHTHQCCSKKMHSQKNLFCLHSLMSNNMTSASYAEQLHLCTLHQIFQWRKVKTCQFDSRKIVLPQHFYPWCWGGYKDTAKLKPKA
jgi:hypothetical protein